MKRTPLRRSQVPLAARTPLARTRRLRQRSPKREDQFDVYRPMVNSYLEVHKTCARCGAPSTCVHHTRGREGWRLLHKPWWKPSCDPCNLFAETETGAALAEGWLHSALAVERAT